MAKLAKDEPTPEDREAFKRRFPDAGVSVKRDDKGVYCCTHRCRSPSYASVDKMNKSRVKFVESTG